MSETARNMVAERGQEDWDSELRARDLARTIFHPCIWTLGRDRQIWAESQG